MQQHNQAQSFDDLLSFGVIAGVDEVGRGPLAGPVVAAAVILDHTRPIGGLADSKRLTANKRQQVALRVTARARDYAFGRAEVAEIDQLNILHASMRAMERAIAGLTIQPDLVLVDGNRLPHLPMPALAIVKGDDRVAEISAASVIAKVLRDQEMIELAQRFPGYGLEKHKGYPTAVHIAALDQYGPTIIHRNSFAPVAERSKLR